jgi:hypothetical protein
MGKPGGKRSIERHKYTRENNIKMDSTGKRWGGMDLH